MTTKLQDLCYAPTVDNYINECRNVSNESQWIVINEFETNASNSFINESNKTDSRIQGLIFVTDQEIQSPSHYERPKLIARDTTDDLEELKKYSFNSANRTRSEET